MVGWLHRPLQAVLPMGVSGTVGYVLRGAILILTAMPDRTKKMLGSRVRPEDNKKYVMKGKIACHGLKI